MAVARGTTRGQENLELGAENGKQVNVPQGTVGVKHIREGRLATYI